MHSPPRPAPPWPVAATAVVFFVLAIAAPVAAAEPRLGASGSALPSALAPALENTLTNGLRYLVQPHGRGLGFSADIWAGTTFSHTTYKLDLPAGHAAEFGEALRVLREELGATYSPDGDVFYNPRHHGPGVAVVGLTFDPDRVSELTKRAIDIAGEIGRRGVTPEEKCVATNQRRLAASMLAQAELARLPPTAR